MPSYTEVGVATQVHRLTPPPEAATAVAAKSHPPELQELLDAAVQARPNHDLELIEAAYGFAELVHEDQDAFALHHAAAVGGILVGLNLDSITVAAGLLHGVLEDPRVPLSQLRSKFGEEIAVLVDGVSKIRDLTYMAPEAEQAENFRKMLLSMAQDIRVVLIKFADRLHCMRTAKRLDPETRHRMALESRDIYAPLAHRLGIARIRLELEDLSLKWLEPEAYRSLREQINQTREEREAYIEEIRTPLQEALENAGIQADIQGRAKNFYSIYGKMARRGKSLQEIYDLTAIRIIVNTVKECYHAMGLVHAMYSPVMSRLKDFIATPKSNMYQSLHTTVIGPKGVMLEVQIRTWDMHHTSEVGIAAHWRYKEGKGRPSELDRHMAWLRSLLEWQQETTDPHEFIEELKTGLFSDEIFVFTPKGDLIQLPEGASPLDFAFAVHTDVGLRCTGARVNGQMVPFSHILQTGDTVEVNTSPHQRPSRDWLKIIKSTKARSRIRRWLREEEYAQSVRLGQEILERELKKNRKRAGEDDLTEVAAGFDVADVEHLYAAVGNGDISAGRVLNRLFPEDLQPQKKARSAPPKRRKKSPLKIHGLNNLMVHFARCCGPIPGDPVLGLITRGQGISVHRRDCSNIRSSPEDRERIVELDWDVEQDETFTVQIQVSGMDRPNFLRDVTQAIADMSVHVRGGELKTVDGEVGDRFEVEIKDSAQLSELIRKVLAVPGVTSVLRLDDASEEKA